MPPNPHNLPEHALALDSQMKAYNATMAEAAKNVVFEKFPSKILSLSGRIDTFASPSSPFSTSNPAFQCDTTILQLPVSIPTDVTFSPASRTRTPTNGPASTSTSTSASHAHPQSSADAGAASSSSVSAPAAASTDIHPDISLAEEGEEKSMRTGMKSNPIYKAIGEVMEQEGTEVLQLCMDLRRWLATVTPPVEEGNNTGVEIQELALGFLNALQNLGSDCSNYLSTARANRAAVVKAYLRTPGIEDRLLALEEGDRIEVFGAKQLLMLLQSKYIEVMNVFQKNWVKICEPKGHRERWD